MPDRVHQASKQAVPVLKRTILAIWRGFKLLVGFLLDALAKEIC